MTNVPPLAPFLTACTSFLWFSAFESALFRGRSTTFDDAKKKKKESEDQVPSTELMV